MPGPTADELLLYDFIQYYAMALDLDERDMYEKYILAGGDPDKFEWSDEWQIPGPEVVSKKIMQFASGRMKTKPQKIDLAEIAEIQGGFDKAYQLEDGSFVNEAGELIEVPPGYVFIKSEKLKQQMLDNLMGS